MKSIFCFVIVFLNFNFFSQDFVLEFRKLEKQIRFSKSAKFEVLVLGIESSTTNKIILKSWARGKTYFWKSEYDSAFFYINRACEKAIKTKNTFVIAELHSDLGQTLLVKNDASLALTYFLKANDFFLKKGKADQIAKSFINLGELYRKINQLEKSLEFLQKSRRFLKSDNELKAQYYNRMAAVYYEKQMGDSSIYFSEKALTIARKIKNIELQAISENEIAAVRQNQDREIISLQRFGRIEKLWRSINNLRYAMDARIKQMEIYHRYKIHNIESLKFALETEKEIQGKNWYDVELHAYDLLHEIYFDFKEFVKADDYLKKYCWSQLNLEKQRNSQDLEIAARLYTFEKTQKIINEQKLALENQNLKAKTSMVERHNLTVFLIALSIIITIIFIFYLIQFKKKKELSRQKGKLIHSNKQLTKSLIQNEALVQEIHHRVKNNLQSISILVEMQMKRKNDLNSNPLEDVYRRITSMVLVHEMLYQQENIVGIAAINYIEKLILTIQDLNLVPNKKIQFDLNIQDVVLDTTSSIALGMITSEIISNSIKHAFHEVENPKIELHLKSKKNLILVDVKDNGLKQQNKQAIKSNLGLKLIKIFIEQIEGSYSLDSQDGFHYKIQFENKLAKND